MQQRTGRQEPTFELLPDSVRSDGRDAGRLAAAYGMRPDPWQAHVLDGWLARTDADRFAASRCGLCMPRQNGKNAVLEMRELYGLSCIGERILHTAHEVRTARKAFMRLAGFFENERYPELVSMVSSIRRANGQEAIYLNNGASIEFSARSRGAARGFTVDLVVLDEAQELTDEQLEALLPTLAAAPLGNRQYIYTGTAPGPNSPGEVFRRLRNGAHEGEDEDPLCWHEWCVDEVGDTSDRDRWYMTNPALGIRIDEGFVASEHASMSAEGFARERLGHFTETDAYDRAVDPVAWDACATDDAPDEGKTTYGVKFSADGTAVAVAGCKRPDEGKPHVEVVTMRGMPAGMSWLCDFIERRQDGTAAVAIDGRAYAGAAFHELHERGVYARMLVAPTASQVCTAAQMLVTAVDEGGLTHYAQPDLDKCVKGCSRRAIGNMGGWGFGDGTAPGYPVEAVSLALWANETTRRDPGGGLSIW